MEQLALREIANVTWGVVALSLVVIMMRHLSKEVMVKGWYREIGNRVAISLMIYFLGESIYRFWIVLVLLPIGIDPQKTVVFGFMGGMMAFIGALCTIRLFSETRIGNWGWFVSYLVAAATAVLVYGYQLGAAQDL